MKQRNMVNDVPTYVIEFTDGKKIEFESNVSAEIVNEYLKLTNNKFDITEFKKYLKNSRTKILSMTVQTIFF